MTIWLLIPIAIVAISFLMKPLRKWLERCAADAEARTILVDNYYTNANRFLKLTDPKKDEELREMIVWVGHEMVKGSTLIKFTLFRMRKRAAKSKLADKTDQIFGDLSEEASHAFSRALASALLLSSYQSVFFGRQYRSMLQLLIKPTEKEIKEPEQIVVRFRQAKSFDHQHWHHKTA